ncbi:prealbumin-like fold domain-containing protein [Agromyces albus]|uniref:SpaA-like prealbumin fold domain-containing protein n=1 Tax=Agromyces albus TaxID=205332 RepID=A0A4V1QX34_9MICO|nr:DUF5979 domain-containing protein [Agromyces albus]RXZ68266.1 hypothetical protein ESP51_14425 [Agromyces albus]
MSRRKGGALVAITALLAALFTPLLVASPASAAVVCDVGDFEIDGNLTPEDCPPGFDDWGNVPFDSTTQGGTYSASSKEDEDPATWTSAGNTPDKGTFAEVFSYARIVDGDYYTYVAWSRDNNTGTGGYAIEITNAGERVAPDGTPQPDRSLGGTVFYVTMQGAALPDFVEGCVYTSVADFPGTCSSDETGYFSEISADGLFFEIGLNLTEFSGVAPGCPPVSTETTVYVRSQTGQASTDGNLKGYVSPLEVTPPSTCGFLTVTKESLNDLADDSGTVFDYTVDGTAIDPIVDALLVGETDEFFDVDPGTDYTLAESIPADAPWSLYSIVCTQGDDVYVLYENGAPTGTTFPVSTGETTDCVITNATSYLDVSKLTNPVDTTTDFSFSVNGGTPFPLSGGETTAPFQLVPGTSVTITEDDLAGWTLSDIVCTIDGQEVIPTAEDLDAGFVTVSTVAGESVNCAFTNDTSFVTVTKQTLPDGSAQAFDFTVDGAPVSLTDGQTSQAFQYVPGTEVTIAETVPEGWDLTDITCTVDGVEVDESVTVTTVAGTTIDCVFTNRQDGTIIINKSLVGEDDTTFEYTGSWLDPEGFGITTVNGIGSETFTGIDPDTYTVTELPIEGYDGTDLICVDSDGNGTASTVDGIVGTINLDPGETVECTYTNTQRARLLVDKETVPDEYDQDFGFVFSNGQFQTPFTLNDSTDDEASPWTSGFIVPGSYSVTETVPESWTLTDISCGDRDGDGTTIELAAGQVVTCVFTNTADTGQVSLTKSVTGVDSSFAWSFDFELTEEPGGTPDPRTVDNSALPGSATATWSDLNVGSTYTLVESDVPDGWSVGDIACTGLTDADGVADGFQFVVTPGLVLACTVTNAASPADVDVEKTVSGVTAGYAWEFDFTINPTPAGQDATQATSGVGPDSDVVSWTGLTPGVVYTITEEQVLGFAQGEIVCETEEGTLDDLNGAEPGVAFMAQVGVSIDCFVTNRAVPVDIDITKSAVGGDGEFTFLLQPLDANGDPNGDPIEESVTTVGGTGVVTFDNLTPGSRFSLAEQNPGGGWTVGVLTCTVTHADQSTDPLDVSDFTIEPGDSIACEITNTAKSTIVIVKEVQGDDATFEFTGTWLDPEAFEITAVGGTGSETFSEVDPGAYTVTETPEAGYDGRLVDCVETDAAGTVSTWDGLVGTINLDPGETVTCTYSNVQRGEILVDKETVPDEFDQDFDFVFVGGEAPVEFTLNDATDDEGDLWSSGLMPPGTYTIDELVPEFWELTDIDCGVRDGDGTTIDLEPGDVVTCTFTNTAEVGEVSLTKSVEGVDPSYEWSFDFALIEEPDGTPDLETVDNSALPGSATATWSDLEVGSTYTLIETDVPDGWTIGDIVCNAGEIEDASDDPGFQFTVTPGLVLECELTNVAAPADVDVEKTVSGVAEGFAWDFDFTIDPVPAGQDATQTTSGVGPDSDVVSWSDLVPGATYTITEEEVAGWEQGALTCETEGGELTDLNGAEPGFQFEAEVGVSIDCSVTNRAVPVDLDVTKSAVGGDGTFEFELQPLDGAGEPVGDPIVESVTTVGGSGVAIFENLAPGSRFSLAEADPGSGWIAGDLDCTVTHADDSTEPLDVSDFTIEPGDSISCEIENVARGKIIIVKNVEGDDATFEFEGTWLNPVDFEITTNNGSGSQTFENVDPGEYTVEEVEPVGYDGTELICTETVEEPEGGTTVEGLVGTIDLDPGETVICTFTNVEWGVLLVDKATIPAGDPTEFDFGWGPASSIELNPFTQSGAAADDPFSTGPIEPDRYAVKEVAPEGWRLVGIECVGGEDPSYVLDDGSTPAGSVAEVDVPLQSTVLCTFTNAKRGPVDVDKVVDAGSVVDHGDGTWSIDYTITVRSDSYIDEEYDLSDKLLFGGGITPISATVESLDGVTLNPGWNGSTDILVAEDAVIPAQGTHQYEVSVRARVATTVTAGQADCTVGFGESGSGLLNRAEVDFWSGSDAAEACAPVKVRKAPPLAVTGIELTALWLGVGLLGFGALVYALRRRPLYRG